MKDRKIEMPKNTMSGDRSSPMPPTPIGGITRRTGPSTGSVIEYRKPYTVAIPEFGEMGNQERMILANMTMR